MDRITGYNFGEGRYGIRNLIAIIPTCLCANDSAKKIKDFFEENERVVLVSHNQGCGQMGENRKQTVRVILGLASNPNVSSVLFIGLGCENIQAKELMDEMPSNNKIIHSIVAIEEGGASKTYLKGIKLVKKMLEKTEKINKSSFEISKILIGLKCGFSDSTSGIASNPIVGMVSDMIINQGGTVIMAETPEAIGAEHILAKRAKNNSVANQLNKTILKFEKNAKETGVDVRGANPSPGNIKGGLTTLEEKSLGAIKKGGDSIIEGVLSYGETPKGNGLYFMNSPGRCPEVLTSLSAAGCHLILFTTGGGALGSSLISPVIKVSANPNTIKLVGKEHVDVDVSGVIDGKEQLSINKDKVYKEFLAVCSGKKTKGEKVKYGYTSIWSIGPHM